MIITSLRTLLLAAVSSASLGPIIYSPYSKENFIYLKINHRSTVKSCNSGRIKRSCAIIANDVPFIYFIIGPYFYFHGNNFTGNIRGNFTSFLYINSIKCHIN
jgi:hypothetical protein